MSLNVPMVVSPDARYAYASGVVRGKWEKRLKKADFARILESRPEEVGKVIAELGYTGADSDIEAALSAESLRLADLVESLIEDEGLAALPRIYTDFTNSAVAVKASLFGFDAEPLFLIGGNLTLEMIEGLLSGGISPQNALQEELREAMISAKRAFAETSLQLTIDAAIDSHFGAVMKRLFFGSGREFLAEFTRRWLDYKNFTAYLRLRTAGFDIDLFKGFYIEGGHLDREDYSRWEDGEIDAIASRLVFSIYGKPFADAVATSIREKNFAGVSLFFEELLEEFLRDNIFVPFGVEVVLAFALLKIREIRTVGAIVRMKSARLEKEAITERVRYGDI